MQCQLKDCLKAKSIDKKVDKIKIKVYTGCRIKKERKIHYVRYKLFIAYAY